MPTFRSVEAWRAHQDRRAAALRRQSVKSASQAATFMQRMARLLAPLDSGETRRGITKRPVGRGKYVVVSSVPGPFPQNMWANQTAPYRTLRFKDAGGWIPPSRSRSGRWVRAFPPGSVVRYGDGSHRITGKPRFFHFAALRTREKFKKIARENVRKALRVSIG